MGMSFRSASGTLLGLRCVIHLPGKDQCVLVGVSWVLGLRKYKLCKVVTLAPRFTLVNNLARRLCFREHGGEPPGNEAKTPLLFMRPRDEKMLTITVSRSQRAMVCHTCSIPVLWLTGLRLPGLEVLSFSMRNGQGPIS